MRLPTIEVLLKKSNDSFISTLQLDERVRTSRGVAYNLQRLVFLRREILIHEQNDLLGKLGRVVDWIRFLKVLWINLSEVLLKQNSFSLEVIPLFV